MILNLQRSGMEWNGNFKSRDFNTCYQEGDLTKTHYKKTRISGLTIEDTLLL